MGGTSASLTDQDIQDGQGDGLEDVSGRVGGSRVGGSRVGGNMVGGSIAILGAGTSPRRTRSGKVVKYIED
jgi:hypothetical protein